jgi:hypothetical protein
VVIVVDVDDFGYFEIQSALSLVWFLVVSILKYTRDATLLAYVSCFCMHKPCEYAFNLIHGLFILATYHCAKIVL